jgi:hypothetical protein
VRAASIIRAISKPCALMMEVARTSETLVNFYQTTRCYNPEDSHPGYICIGTINFEFKRKCAFEMFLCVKLHKINIMGRFCLSLYLHVSSLKQSDFDKNVL